MKKESLIYLNKCYNKDFPDFCKISKRKYIKIKELFEFEIYFSSKNNVILNNSDLCFQISESLEYRFNYPKYNNELCYFKSKMYKRYRINFEENSISIIKSLIEKIKIKDNLNKKEQKINNKNIKRSRI